MTPEEEYKQETGRDATGDNQYYIKFVEWLKSKYEAEHKRRLAAEMALKEITEEYIGMEGFVSKTAPEEYLQVILKRIYNIAVKAMEGK